MKVLLYGTTGYVGGLVARAAVRAKLPVVLAGRNGDTVTPQANVIGVPYRIFGLDRPEAIDEQLRAAGVGAVLNCAGPFANTRPPLLEACLRLGLHYLDLAGEYPDFEAVREHDAAAQERGVLLLPGAGFAVVPTDCLAARVASRLPDADRLLIGLQVVGSLSRGATTAVLESLKERGVVRSGGELKAAHGGGKLQLDFGYGPVDVMANPWRGDVVSAYHSTHVPNIACYTAASGDVGVLLKGGKRLPARNSLRGRRTLPDRDGPTALDRQAGFTICHVQAVDAAGVTAWARLRGPDAHDFTAQAAVQVLRRLREGAAADDLPAGFTTPAAAFGSDLVLDVPGVSVLEDDSAIGERWTRPTRPTRTPRPPRPAATALPVPAGDELARTGSAAALEAPEDVLALPAVSAVSAVSADEPAHQPADEPAHQPVDEPAWTRAATFAWTGTDATDAVPEVVPEVVPGEVGVPPAWEERTARDERTVWDDRARAWDDRGTAWDDLAPIAPPIEMPAAPEPATVPAVPAAPAWPAAAWSEAPEAAPESAAEPAPEPVAPPAPVPAPEQPEAPEPPDAPEVPEPMEVPEPGPVEVPEPVPVEVPEVAPLDVPEAGPVDVPEVGPVDLDVVPVGPDAPGAWRRNGEPAREPVFAFDPGRAGTGEPTLEPSFEPSFEPVPVQAPVQVPVELTVPAAAAPVLVAVPAVADAGTDEPAPALAVVPAPAAPELPRLGPTVRRPRVIAHRGAAATHRENTIPAFEAAVAAGARMIELDVRRTSDGVLVVHHDADVDGRALIDTASFELPDWIPTLDDALDACAGVDVNIEIKNDPRDPDFDPENRVAERVVALLARRGDADHTLISSFDLTTVGMVRALDPTIATAWLFVVPLPDANGAVARAAAAGHIAIHPMHTSVTPELVQAAHAAGLSIHAWTVDDPDRMVELAMLGVDGICTNDPALAAEVFA